MIRIRSASANTVSPLLVGRIQQSCACGQHTPGGACDQCRNLQATGQRRLQSAGRSAGGVPVVVREVVRSPGAPLDAGARRFMEGRFAHDFSRVRVHTDARASASAQAIGARAYTVGPNLVFAQGHYQPHLAAGRALLAHELTHVVQQEMGVGALQADSSIGREHGAAEREADRVARAVLSGRRVPRVGVPGRGVQRSANTCTYGEIRSWAITSQSDFTAPAGLGNAKASIGTVCGPANCHCVDGSNATAPGDQHAWSNIVAAAGTDRSAGGTLMCVGTQGCGFVHRCTRCQNGQRRQVEREANLQPVGTTTVTGKGTLYFYSDPLQGWCNAEDRRTGCQGQQTPRRG